MTESIHSEFNALAEMCEDIRYDINTGKKELANAKLLLLSAKIDVVKSLVILDEVV